MDLIPLSFILSGFLALPAAAAGSSPAPALVRLDHVLTQTLQEKAQGQLAPERVAEFAVKFRGDLAAAKADSPPTPENTDLHTRILARLGELGELNHGEVGAGVESGLGDLRYGRSRIHFSEITTPAAIATEKAILGSEPFNSKGAEPGNLAIAIDSPRTRKIHFAPVDSNKLPIILPVTIAPAAAPPGLTDAPASKGSNPIPLLPLSVAAGLGAAAYGISKSKSAYASEDGLDDAHPVEPGPYQKLVAGTILAGAAGAAIFLAGSVVVTAAAPAVLRYAAPVLEQGLRLAGSEAGAINPASATEAAPEAEASAAEVEQVVIKRGDTLNRVWHSAWEENSATSGPKGQSYCRGHWLPIHSVSAILRRGLDINGVTNNAQKGSVFVANEDVTAIVRRSIGGIEEEVLIPLSESHKLVEISRSDIFPGTK